MSEPGEIAEPLTSCKTQWKDWHRNDSEKSNVTWDNRLLEQGHHKYWDNKQKKMRRRLAQTQTDMNLWSTLDPVQTETRLRAQAFQEKLQYARLDNETLADSTDSDSETSTSLVRSASPEITATGEFKKKQVAPNLYVVYEVGDEWPFPRHFQYLEKGYIS
ncbi:hypothetical protein FISHEDRAFT_69272 [Fistulina hepatica ATCC 64428]|uniref:Uncharacterized protein n=1 Tax=Fistulina hepatica ATCC 64428 TaxID=1128425 RepID=A0A0D7AMP1_9AGAR|nr:hypothetical protein FISHEDRAFT_69272 [Fistulina hepatica ATCC 64428]